MQSLKRLSDISQHYHSYIIDLWGVMHDGVNLNVEAYSAVRQLKVDGKKICFLSNAPETAKVIREKLIEIGIAPSDYDGLVTSGEVSKNVLMGQEEKLRSAFFIGTEPQKSVLYEANIDISEQAKDADILLCSGIYDDMLRIEDYQDMLDEALHCHLPMYCVNPDRIVYSGHYQKLVICAGEMAHYYAQNGGTVHYSGKPYPAAYDACRKMMQLSDLKDVLAIGDAFETDMLGAQNVGVDALWIAGGIHAGELQDTSISEDLTIRSEKLLKKYELSPKFAMLELE